MLFTRRTRESAIVMHPFLGSGSTLAGGSAGSPALGACARILRALFDPEPPGGAGHLWPRWLWLRALGLIFFSAFYSLAFQVRGLIGPQGILPAGEYLEAVARRFGPFRLWYAPTVFWLDAGSRALLLVVAAGLVASLLLALNVCPRASIVVCLAAYLSFVAVAQDFAEYQSDGMLLAAGFLSLFFAPRGLRPRLGEHDPPSRASLWMLRFLWLRIYFESGIVKLGSGDPQWRSLTALDRYYQNGPLPNWIGWYAQQLPHAFQAGVALVTLAVELAVVWMVFLPRPLRLLCFFIVTPFQIGIILTANLAFLNYFVLALGFLLLDDRFIGRLFARWKRAPRAAPPAPAALPAEAGMQPLKVEGRRGRLALAAHALCLTWVFYNTTALLLMMILPGLALPAAPIVLLEPFRISNEYGLFAVMTRERLEIEFQGTRDGATWVAYPFRYKPQDPAAAPRFYAPYQPRFDWNLWFASLGPWRQDPWLVRLEVLLLRNDPAVLALFAGNPFADAPPREVRAVEWRYSFTDLATKRRTGMWWNREFLGLYAPAVGIGPDGGPHVVEMPAPGAP